MPWKECNRMDERLRFVARLLEGESMTSVCADFGISRKTGYKLFNRYKDDGLMGLADRSRRPKRQGNRLPVQIEQTLVSLKRDYPDWGAPKVCESFLLRYPHIKCPATSTVHAIFERHGLVQARKKRRYRAEGTTLQHATQPNGLWCADFKGEFRLGNRNYCYPLTITDYRSRYLLACEALANTQMDTAYPIFERAFYEFGVPLALRTDNGVPFAAPNALFGLSRLAVWWLRLGIVIERIKPGHPEQNGRHERMHLTLKKKRRSQRSSTYSNKVALIPLLTDTTTSVHIKVLGCRRLVRSTHPPFNPINHPKIHPIPIMTNHLRDTVWADLYGTTKNQYQPLVRRADARSAGSE